MSTQMQSFTASDGLKLAYRIDDYTDPWRKADTLIMVHAAMGSSKRFYAWVPHLARDFRVVRLDQRGHGESGIPTPEQMTFERLGKDVIELMDHLGLAAANLAGSSAGGIVSQSVAINYPERVKSLASYAAPPGMKVGRQDYNGWLAKIGSKGLAAFLRETIADRMDLSQVEPGFVDWFIAESARNKVESLARFVPTVAVIDHTADLHKIRCPVMVVAPGADPIHLIDEYELLRREIKQCEFIVYEGLPHNITDTVPDRCAKELLRFLKSV
jgi:pimeloyl-ACP methyl ester carboxylesterase